MPMPQAIVQDALTLLKHNHGWHDLHTFEDTKQTLTNHLLAFEQQARYLTVGGEGGLRLPSVSEYVGVAICVTVCDCDCACDCVYICMLGGLRLCGHLVRERLRLCEHLCGSDFDYACICVGDRDCGHRVPL